MNTTTDLTTLKINYLTQAQYDAALLAGTINENEIYLTPQKGATIICEFDLDSVKLTGTSSMTPTEIINAVQGGQYLIGFYGDENLFLNLTSVDNTSASFESSVSDTNNGLTTTVITVSSNGSAIMSSYYNADGNVTDNNYVHTDNNYTNTDKGKVDKIRFVNTATSLTIGSTDQTSTVNIYGNSTNLIGISTSNTTDGDNIRHRLVVQSDKAIIQTVDFSTNPETYTTLYKLEPKPYMRNLSDQTDNFKNLNQKYTAQYDGFMLMAMHTQTGGNSLLRVQDVTGTTNRYVMMLSETSTSQAVYVSGMFPLKQGNTYKITSLTNATVYYAYVQNFR